MIIVIRISGKVKIKEDIEETLFRLRLRRKFSCILIDEKDANRMGMLDKVKNYVSYGDIEKAVLIKLIEKRAVRVDKKEIKDAEKIAESLEKGKSLEEVELKPFFRLGPPRGGLKSSKKNYPKGVLGKNKEINKLVERML
jgi:large subunit ribosomal protein L30